MVLLPAIFISLVVLLLRGGSLSDLAPLRFRWAWAAVGSCVLQLGVMYVLPTEAPWVSLRGPLLLVAYAMLLLGLVANWRLSWMPLLTAGAALNFAVMAANGGQMPVAPETLAHARMVHLAPGLAPGTPVRGSKDVVLPREDTLLWPLSDVIVWPRLPRNFVFSVGDVLIALGAALLLQSLKPSGDRRGSPVRSSVPR